MTPIIEIAKEFRFEAAHSLPSVPDGHPCRHIHGHSYRVEIAVRGPVEQPAGWVMDFADISDAVKPLVEQLDHTLLNDAPGLTNPTAENLALWLWRRLESTIGGLHAITVWETATCRATYRGERRS